MTAKYWHCSRNKWWWFTALRGGSWYSYMWKQRRGQFKVSGSFICSVKRMKMIHFIMKIMKVTQCGSQLYISSMLSHCAIGPAGYSKHGLVQSAIWQKTELVFLEAKGCKHHYKKAIYLRSVQMPTSQGDKSQGLICCTPHITSH